MGPGGGENSPEGSAFSSKWGVLAQSRIDRVAKSPAEKGKAEGREQERNPARQYDPRRVADEGVAVIEHGAPARSRRAPAKTEKAQPGLDRDGDGNIHAG